MRTTITLDHYPDSCDHHRVRLLLRVEADPADAAPRTPLNLALVLDRSGSMSGSKLAAARKAAAHLVRRLRPEDVIAVVAYDDEVLTIAEPATGTGQADLTRRIAAIRSGGSTNLSGGWLRGRELIARSRRDGVLSRVLLLTDGLANVGITRADALIGMCAAARDDGITTTTLGFGEDYDARLLAEMADAGGGHSYYIETPDQAPAVFGEEISGLLGVTAQNLQVTVQPSPLTRLAVVHHAYPRTELSDGVRYSVGDLYAREPALVLAEFVIGPLRAEDAAVDVARLVVEADVIAAEGRVERSEIRLPVRFSPAEGPRVDPEIRREVLLFEAAHARHRALDQERGGDAGAARETLREVADRLRALAADDAALREEAADLGTMASVFGPG